MVALTEREAIALMVMQYEFNPLASDPYAEASEKLGIAEDELLEMLRRLSGSGVLKRVGFYLNYRSQGKEAALVALDAPDVDAVRDVIIGDDLVTHAYVRDDPDYNVWLVVKRSRLDELVRAAQEISERAGARRYVVLRSVKTYKLSVKYDLFAGISRSGPHSVIRPNPPRPEELGVSQELARLVSRLPLVRDPYGTIASSLRTSRDKVIESVGRLLDAGVLADPGAALDGERVGFKYNGMVLVDSDAPAEACEAVTRNENTTHVVLREPYPPSSYEFRCYAMVHAISRELVEKAAEGIARAAGATSYRVLYSLRDLKPGVVR